jgi:hypothetical protein
MPQRRYNALLAMRLIEKNYSIRGAAAGRFRNLPKPLSLKSVEKFLGISYL